MAGTIAPQICECEYCGEMYSPAGIENHQMWCDENPHPGIAPEKQEELREQGILA